MTDTPGHSHGPGGLYADENHHDLGEDGSAHVDESGQTYKLKDGEKTALTGTSDQPTPPSPGPGWVSFASWPPATDVKRLSGRWTVPAPPTDKAMEIVFLHVGLEGTSAGQKIFAPIVLQWGLTPYGGGNYWSVACWLALGSDITVGNYIKVDVGDEIQGEVVHEVKDGVQSWSMRGTSGDQVAKLSFTLEKPLENQLAYGGVLEAYAVDMQCTQYPASPSVIFSELEVDAVQRVLTPAWKATNEVINCGQRTEVISSKEVQVFFHGVADPAG